jgi:hypothetical protein
MCGTVSSESVRAPESLYALTTFYSLITHRGIPRDPAKLILMTAPPLVRVWHFSRRFHNIALKEIAEAYTSGAPQTVTLGLST